MRHNLQNIIATLLVRLCTFVLFMLLLGGILSLLFCGCKSKQEVISSEVRADSTSFVSRIVYIDDTIHFAMPHFHDANKTSDSTSTLENDYAISYAAIIDGYLYHTLDNKEVDIAVPTKKEIQYQDKTVYRNRVVTKTKTVYVKPKFSDMVKSWFQSIGFISFVIISSFLIWIIIKTRNRQRR